MIRAVVIGVSAGGLEAMKVFLPALPAAFPLPISIVQHRDARADGFLAEYLGSISALTVREAEDKQPLEPGHAYLAPAGYHLLIEPDESFSLSVDARVNYSCPSVDVLFESASDVYGPDLIGVVLTGANADGAHGLKVIKQRGGLAIVQHPATAQAEAMPRAALATVEADYVIHLDELAPLLIRLSLAGKETYGATA